MELRTNEEERKTNIQGSKEPPRETLSSLQVPEEERWHFKLQQRTLSHEHQNLSELSMPHSNKSYKTNLIQKQYTHIIL